MTIVTYKKLLLLATLPALMLASCSREELGDNDADSRTPVAFTAVVQSTALPPHTNTGGSSPATRTALDSDGNTAWTQGDAVSIFMLTPGGTLPDDLVPGRANVLHNVNPENGALTPADGTPMYYPRNTAVDIIAWHTSSTPDDNYILNLNTGDQTAVEKQLALDILYSDNAKSISSGDNPVVLVFHHLMSKVKFDITLGLGLANGILTDVRLEGVIVEGSFDMRDGSINKLVSPAGSVRALKSGVAADGTDASYTALLIPQDANSTPRTIVVTVNGKEYTGTLPATDAYAANTMYTYPVTVCETGVEVGIPTTDVPWTEGELPTVTFNGKIYRIIRNADDLKRFADDVNSGQRDLNAIQTADIDLNGIDNWKPIGIKYLSDLRPFTGIYNGNGYIISNLKISNTKRDDAVGLFGMTDGDALLTGIHLRDVEIILPDQTFSVGTLVGLNSGGSTVSLCSAQGIINTSEYRPNVGGLVGTNAGTITRCRTNVEITVDRIRLLGQLSADAGGITGVNSGGLLFACHAIGSVTMKVNTSEGNSIYAGGIAGENFNDSGSTIYCCIAEGDVSVTSETANVNIYAGGLVGYNYRGLLNSCYARGTATASTIEAKVGAIVGYMEGGNVDCCYGAGAVGKGTSNCGDASRLICNINPGTGDILQLMNRSYSARGVITRYDPDATPAYGINIYSDWDVSSSDFWLYGDGTWPVLYFTRNDLK
ncbi:fimbrillin family protein [Parabacteroides goldsteinii]|uniref:fimbrillin family protein n=1 Tax=Parabacteroides goldsteinii TaxID=328812 RepID=UPI00338F6F31